MQIEKLQAWFVQNKKTLALAESCTGGKMSSLLTAIPGASDYFLGSLVTYSNGLKISLLHVSPATIQKYGAVSSETALEMLSGLFKVTPADYGIAVTGVAGPTGSKPIGTIHYALGQRGFPPQTGTFHLAGSRETIILSTADLLLDLLLKNSSG